jgi:hypothetical protein
MLQRLNAFILWCSQTWWAVALLFAGQFGSMRILNAITQKFPSQTAGDIPFDMQNSLTTEQVFTQLSGYSEAAFASYYRFQAVDFAFPLFGGLFLAAVCAFAVRHAAPRWYAWAAARNLFVLILLATAFDYLENVGMLWTVSAWPAQVQAAAQLGVTAKVAKLTCLFSSVGVTAAFLLVAGGRWVSRATGLVKT